MSLECPLCDYKATTEHSLHVHLISHLRRIRAPRGRQTICWCGMALYHRKNMYSHWNYNTNGFMDCLVESLTGVPSYRW
jgi:hypothetical protein